MHHLVIWLLNYNDIMMWLKVHYSSHECWKMCATFTRICLTWCYVNVYSNHTEIICPTSVVKRRFTLHQSVQYYSSVIQCIAANQHCDKPLYSMMSIDTSYSFDVCKHSFNEGELCNMIRWHWTWQNDDELMRCFLKWDFFLNEFFGFFLKFFFFICSQFSRFQRVAQLFYGWF